MKIASSCAYAEYIDFPEDTTLVVALSPYTGLRDTIHVSAPMDNIVCMSSSGIAALSLIGADSVISAVSGLRYVYSAPVRERACEIGFDAALDYERILSLKPDLLVTYSVSGAVPQYVSKLRNMGLQVLVLSDHLERHPLARAEYVRLYGRLTGQSSVADSVFAMVRRRYENVAADSLTRTRVPVLMNVPYGDIWYVPGADSYMARLVYDAGGEILGSVKGIASGTITIENAYHLSQKADIWLNPGNCRTRDELRSLHQLFPDFGPLAENAPIYNNILRVAPGGGNDFWESGAMRPDLILKDIRKIIVHAQGGPAADSLVFFLAL